MAPAKSTAARSDYPGREEMHTGPLAMDYASGISLDRLAAVEKERLEFELQLSAEVQQALLLLYTDGVTEAIDAQGDEFGPGRLAETVEGKPGA